MASVSFRNIEKAYGSTKVIHGISFEIADGEFMVLVGPSGCGKSTLLRMLAGLEAITGGEIAIEATASADELLIRLTNPFQASGDHHSGNRMALANIRERLQLHFDAEASLQSRAQGATYEVTLRLPLITAPR